jgi:membrane protein implicated in regulation of membrane protease activity
VTSGEPLLVLAWLAAAAGLVGLALVVVTHWPVPWYVPRGLALLALAGIATLIWRMPHKRGDDDGNGAQV